MNSRLDVRQIPPGNNQSRSLKHGQDPWLWEWAEVVSHSNIS